jgi:transcriptional regulator with XRE-family HTH domain
MHICTMKDDVKKHAFALFMDTNLTQKEIAERVGVTEKTITQWKQAEDWEIQRSAMNITPKRMIAGYLIQLDRLRKHIEEREENPWPDASESDRIHKVAKAMKMLQKDLTLTDYINSFEQLYKFINVSDSKLANAMLQFQNEFIRNKANELNA